jgi:flagellar motor component MotA
MDKVGEKLGIVHPFTGKFSSYLLEEPVLNEITHMSEIQKELLQMLAKGYVLSVIEDYNKGKCIEKGKEEDILSEYLYKFIKSEISKAPEGLFYRRIY